MLTKSTGVIPQGLDYQVSTFVSALGKTSQALRTHRLTLNLIMSDQRSHSYDVRFSNDSVSSITDKRSFLSRGKNLLKKS